ncbi:MAG: hypothetical protein U9N45_07395, partial [Gemmatimonadota bacterium]|nr:hypothetical protein [Gemmatimonadota bacterium]
MKIRLAVAAILLAQFIPHSLPASTAPELTEMYMRLAAACVEPFLESQNSDGAYFTPAGEPGFSEYEQIVIYPLAYLFVTSHPLNSYHGDKRLLDSVIRCGDMLSRRYEPDPWWPMNQWLVQAWLEAYVLVRDHLSRSQRLSWEKSFEHWCGIYAQYLAKNEGKPDMTAVGLGTGTNHYTYYAASVYRAGHVLGHPEWVGLAVRSFRQLIRAQHPDGFWPEHYGPVVRYTFITIHGIGLYYAFTGDPEALEAMRRAKDFLLRFTYPDGSTVAVIDERNRYYPGLAAMRGLMSLSHWPDGRRYCRIMTERVIEKVEREGAGAIEPLLFTRYVDAARYSAKGDEAPVPQEMENYETRLSCGAYLMRRGDWIVTLSGIISPLPPWEGNRWILDRYTWIEVWHKRCGLVIGGGNTKRQPQIATLLMAPSNDALDFRPKGSRIAAHGDSARLDLEFEMFRASLEVKITDSNKLLLRAGFTQTTQPNAALNRYECNLQLQLKSGQTVNTSRDSTLRLSENPTRLSAKELGSSIENELWRISVPEGKTSLRFPFRPFNSYELDGHTGIEHAVGIL